MSDAANHLPLLVSRPGRILVADDEKPNRRLIGNILAAQGHEVFMADDGQQALDKAFALLPDVVLLDVGMPNLDGFEVCRRLKADLRTAPIPILIVTALRDRADRLTGMQAGANDFLTKPIDAEEIRLRVKNAVQTKHLYDRVREDLAKLREMETLQENLTHMIVHDLRSPLTVISGTYDVIFREKDRLSPTQFELFTLGRECCVELIEMVRSLLDISRMEVGQMPISRTPCDLREIARDAADAVAVLAREKKLILAVGGDSASGLMDRDLIFRVLVNLLGNAIKFSPEGETIAVQVSSTEQAVRVAVKDQGRGIPAEYHGKIFEKFGQVDPYQQQEIRKHSSGLGLAFCKLAVEAHGGRIGVESEVGQGSTFWFTIPAGEVASPQAQSAREGK